MDLIERLKRLGDRRAAEGIYTDQNIVDAAIAEINRLRIAMSDQAKDYQDRLDSRGDRLFELRQELKLANSRLSDTDK